VSQLNAPASLAEPDFYNSALATQLTGQYGEKFTLATGPILPLDNDPGDATALQVLGPLSYDMNAATMLLERHERGIHAVWTGGPGHEDLYHRSRECVQSAGVPVVRSGSHST
jgi:hypothetical protein